MQNQIFIDTGFVIALIVRSDKHHQEAQLADRYNGRNFLITDTVLLKIGYALSKNYKQQGIEIIDYFLTSDDVEVVRLTPELFERSHNLYKQYQDKQWGLVDCISFTVMWEVGVSEVLTFDKHFLQAGFQVLTSVS